MTIALPPSSQSQNTNEKYCTMCRHHSSYHQLITRDKWAKFGDLVRPGKIPWFCEYLEFDPETREERVCGCNAFQPTHDGRGM